MKKEILLVAALALALAGCQKSEGNFRILIKDAPALPDSLMVTISEVTVHKTGGAWIKVSTQSRTIDLIRLLNAQDRLVDFSLEQGTYTEIRLLIVSGQAVVGGQTYPLVIPSSEIKIPAGFYIQDGGATEVLLDFDAEKSLEVHPVGNGTNEYILRPVITIVSITY